ncbi:MAG TPA: S9 family peptidase [Steroidobacteraceae bacterium]|nr:S9 family peptidase [Steroidobacteraceae bacterium]
MYTTIPGRFHLAIAALACALSAAQAQQPGAAFAHQEHSNLIMEGIPTVDGALEERLEHYLAARQATFLDWLPDGGMLVSTRFADAAQIHRVAAPLGMREQLTYGAEPISTAAVPQVAGAEGFAYLEDRGGDENAQIYYYRLSDHSVRMLTDGKSRHGALVWTRDGRRLAFFGEERNGTDDDIYVWDAGAGSSPRLVVGGQHGTWYPLDWSPDGQQLLLQHYVSIAESYLYVADVASGTLTPLDPSGHKVGIRAARFAPEGRAIYVASDAGGEFAVLRHLDLASHETRELTATIPWDVEDFDVSVDGRYVAYVSNEDGRGRLTVLDSQQKLELSPPGLPAGPLSRLRFDRTGRHLAFSAESPQAPRDVYVYDIETHTLVRWTHSEAGPLDESSFVPAQLVRYPTWDRDKGGRRMISAYLYKPTKAGPHPVVIDIHGGPEAQYTPGFDAFTQFLVNELGYAVIAPNVRGSSGYGRSFMQLDNGVLREDAVRDIGSLLVWIGLQPDLDRQHVIVMGGSYGGYMALASLIAYNDRLQGGIDLVGISNFVSFLEHTSAYRRDLRRAEYGDERDPRTRDFLNRISPLNNARLIRRPLLVVQGLNDPRVPPAESQRLVAQLRAYGREVWYLAAKDEGHGFRKKGNRDAYLSVAALFLSRLAQSGP